MRNAIVATLVLAAVVLAEPCLNPRGEPFRPRWTHIVYEYAGANTMVLVDLSCGEYVEQWYVGFFYGHDQPTLREFADIQNTASLLLP